MIVGRTATWTSKTSAPPRRCLGNPTVAVGTSKNRVSRSGRSIHWEGEILRRVVDRIQEHEGFLDTNWNDRSVVEITGETKSQGWFLHAITGDEWFLQLKFRVRPKTFKRDELTAQIPLLRANDLDDIPVYGNKPRVQLKQTTNRWQEISIKVNNLKEIDIPGFWDFLDQAVESFLEKIERKKLRIDEETPWAKLGKAWHYARRGFPAGQKVEWKKEVLERLEKTLQELVPEGEFEWHHKSVVHLFLPDEQSPCISIRTKKTDGVWLELNSEKDAITLGSVADLASDANIKSRGDKEVVGLVLNKVDQVSNQDFVQFLEQQIDQTRGVENEV